MAVYRPIHYRAGLLRGIHILSSYQEQHNSAMFQDFVYCEIAVYNLLFQKTGKSESGNLSR